MITPGIAIDDGPHKSGIVTTNDLEVSPIRFQSMAAPYVVLRVGMTEGLEVLVEVAPFV